VGGGTVTERPLVIRTQLLSGPWTRTRPDPADELVRRVASMIAGSVDELHVAAVLESMGITDQVAQDSYGVDDVFALADLVHRRLPGVADGAVTEIFDMPARSRRVLRVVTHGLLYIMPSAVYPAVLIMLGAPAMIRGLVFTTALGWVWGTGMSAVGYQLVGEGKERAAGRALRRLGLLGLAVAALAGLLLASTGPGGRGIVAFAVAQMSFQLMSSVLVLYGKELWVALTMLPGFVCGIALLASGYSRALVAPTLVAGGLSVTLLTVSAMITSARAPALPDAKQRIPLSRWLQGTAPSVCYAALCAVFMLFTDSHFVVGRFDLAIAVVPLILGMGTLEWRAHTYTERVSELFRGSAMSGEFGRTAWQLLLAELTNCLASLGILADLLLLMLHEFWSLTTESVMLVDAHVLLGGAFFLGFVLARHQQFGRLLVIMSAVVAANVAVVRWLAPHQEVPVFLLSTAVLLLLQLAALRASFRRVRHYASAGPTRFFRTNAAADSN
jgi:hypothetical protein